MTTPKPRQRHNKAAAAGLLAAGAVAGGVLASTFAAGAATTPSPGPSTYTPSGSQQQGFRDHGRVGQSLGHSGTVTAVHADSNGTTGTVTIATSSATTTYTVTNNSDIDKNGESQLSKLAVGDKVRFSATGTTINTLHAGNETLNAPAGGPGHSGPGRAGRGHGLPLNGSVTAVNANSDGTTGSVTIKTGSGTHTYTVNSASDIDKNGESQLSKLAVGDAVTFSLQGSAIDKLHAGDEAKNAPAPAPTSTSTSST